jgi:3-oxoacyl-[acyl-carrier protein] reductase
MIELKDKVMLVTGGSRGIGRATVLMAARVGANVAIHYGARRDAAESAREEAQQQGVTAIAVQADITRQNEVFDMVERVVGAFGRIDIVVNNAGIWKHDPIDSPFNDVLTETIETNLYGCYWVIKAVVPHMITQKSGSIINIASTAGQRGEAYHSSYASTKGALISLTKSLAVELAPHNIRVNCVAPGWVLTDMSRDALEEDREGSIVVKIPLGRVGTPEELAGPILFLASDLSSFVTGEILNVNGGAVLCG